MAKGPIQSVGFVPPIHHMHRLPLPRKARVAESRGVEFHRRNFDIFDHSYMN